MKAVIRPQRPLKPAKPFLTENRARPGVKPMKPIKPMR